MLHIRWYKRRCVVLSKKIIFTYSCVLIICVSAGVCWAQEKFPNREVSEKLLVKLDAFQPIKDSMRISPNGKRVAFLSVKQRFPGGTQWFAVVDGKDEKKYDLVGRNSAVFSPDSKHLAYVAVSGKVNLPEVNKYFRTSDVFSGEMFVVVDGKEEKRYKHIGDSNFEKPLI